jgi:hypothetical protein
MNLTLFLTITLAVLGLTGSLAAFGGETWRKGDARLLDRVTKRGWLALTCLILAFAVGVAKEVRAARITSASQEKGADQQTKLNTQLAQIQDLQKRLNESAQTEKQMAKRFGELQLGAFVDETMLLASYTRQHDLSEWLGGEVAYANTVRKSIDRVEYALENIQRSPVLVGLLSRRFLDVAPWAIGGLKRYSVDPLRTQDRLNYYACGLLGSTGEMLASMDKPEILKICHGENVRGAACRAELTSELAKHTKRVGRYSDMCPGKDLNSTGDSSKTNP